MSEKPQIVRAHYPHLQTLPTRWSDNDIYGHINNALYYAFFDTAINQYLIKEGGLDISQGEVIGVAAESHCQYLQPLAFPEVMEVGLRVGSWVIRVSVTSSQSSKWARRWLPPQARLFTCS